MRVLLVSRCPPYPLHFGDRLILFHLARELAARGLELELIALSEGQEDRAQLAENEEHFAPYFQNWRWVKAGKRGAWSTAARALFPWRRFPARATQAWSPALWEAARERAPHHHLVHCFGGVRVYECWRALAGKPALITPYESYALYLQRAAKVARGRERWRLRAARLIAAHYESWLYRPFARTVVVAEADRHQLARRQPKQRLALIPNGVDLPEFNEKRPTQSPVLLFVGNYAYAPNRDAALRLANQIFPIIRKHHPKAQLWLVGAAPPSELRALATEQIRVTGFVESLRPHLSRATVFVCPLRFGTGIQNKLLEAFAANLPVVATPLSVAGIAGVVDGQQALLAASDEQLAERTLELLKDPRRQSALAQSARALVAERYGWAGVAARYHALYEQILREG